MTQPAGDARAAMNAMYAFTRHVYDVSRKYYLLGRDKLISDLAPPSDGHVLEIGCGTARNLIKAAQRYPHITLYGIDASDEMLKTARASVARHGLAHRIILKQGYAQNFNPQAEFGVAQFDRILFSYCLSMIPPWRESIDHALALLTPRGEVLIIDFDTMNDMPAWLRGTLRQWLSLFHVHVRPKVKEYCKALPASYHATITEHAAGYYWRGRIAFISAG